MRRSCARRVPRCAALRERLPGARLALVYDNYNALGDRISGRTERASEAVVSIALYPRWVTLFFLEGARGLPDPHKRLHGSGKVVRSIRLDQIEILDEPAVRDLIEMAAEGLRLESGRGKLVIQSISKVQRPRQATGVKSSAVLPSRRMRWGLVFFAGPLVAQIQAPERRGPRRVRSDATSRSRGPPDRAVMHRSQVDS